MTEIAKWRLINSCETVSDLEDAIIAIANPLGLIDGRARQFDAKYMASWVRCIVNDSCDPRYLTRNYGIRQQALYLKQYAKS